MTLRRGKDTVIVVLREARQGERGRPVTEIVGRVTVLGRMQEMTTDDVIALGTSGERQVLHMKKLICASFPGDDLSQVVDGDGVLWNVVGEPKRHRGSRRTQRDAVALRQAGVNRGVRSEADG